MKRQPPQIQVERGTFASGVWWSAAVLLADDTYVTAGYHRSRYAAVRALECRLKQIRNEAERLTEHANVIRAKRGDFDAPGKETA